jgi:4-methyl-5(b-hydroxyethyl)-thiazole monophosphate biosynthesis
MSKVGVFLANGFEEIEALTVVDLLRRVKIEVNTISITGEQYVTGAHQIIVKADELFELVDFNKVDMLVLPGGMPGTKNLDAHKGLEQLLTKFQVEGKKISAICAAPSVLGAKGLLEGKAATCYPGFEGALKGAFIKSEDVVVDGNIVTSKGMGTAIDFSLELISALVDQETAAKTAAAIQYQHYNEY